MSSKLFDPSVGLFGEAKLRKAGRITRKEAVESKEHETTQITKQFKRDTRLFTTIVASSPKHQYQLDLADFSRLSSVNGGFKWMFMYIDVYSRFLWIIPMKNKSQDSVVEAFQSIISQHKPQNVTSDNGSEYINHKFQIILRDNDIEQHLVDVGDKFKTAIVERVIRTIRTLLEKYFTAHSTKKWIDVIDLIVEAQTH